MSLPERQRIVQQMEGAGLVAIIRASSSRGLIETCRALEAGGVTVAEVTMTTPGLEAIHQASQELGERCLIGVGSVTDAATARKAVEAGAEFVVSPVFKVEVVEAAHAMGKPVLAGCLTPTEMLGLRTEAGADVIKVFPANHFGPKYFKDVLAPMPYLKLTPTGGVDLDTVSDWLAAGAVCLGVGSALVRKDLIEKQDWAGLTALASQFVDAVNKARR